MDDILSSHVDPNVNDELLKWLNDRYSGLKKVSATRGNIHKYLGMTIDFSTKGKVKFRMDDYAKGILDEFPMRFGSNDVATTPASSKLFLKRRIVGYQKREKGKCITRMWRNTFSYLNVPGQIYN